jgi:membrane fusion protein (multidrug efflux system)
MATLTEQLDNAVKGQNASLNETQEMKQPAHKGSTKTKRLAIIGGALLVLTGVAGAGYVHYADQISTDDAQVDAHIAPIAPKIFGNVAEILVNDNDTVKTGQVLMRIDPRDYQAKVTQAKAALAAAESQATGARVGVPIVNATTASSTAAAEAQIAAANADYERTKADYERASTSELAVSRADIDAKQATAERARADRARMEPLAAKDEISKQQFDAYIAAARVADSDLIAAQQKLANAESQASSSKAAMNAATARIAAARASFEEAQANRDQVHISSAQAGSASAAVLQARANLEAAELQLSYTTIIAPVDGVVTKKNVQIGQIVQPGQSLMTLVPMSDVYVSANFKETQLAQVKAGQRADVYIDMYDQTFEGVVDSVSNATGSRLSLLPPENATGNYVKIVQRIPVKILVKNLPEGVALRPGMNVEATIFTK